MLVDALFPIGCCIASFALGMLLMRKILLKAYKVNIMIQNAANQVALNKTKEAKAFQDAFNAAPKIRSVKNEQRKFGSANDYIHLHVPGDGDYLFTSADMTQAYVRATDNPEDCQV